MSDTMRNWREMGISDEELYTPKGLDYWLQYPPDEFIQNTVHEVRMLLAGMEYWIKVIGENQEVSSTVLFEVSETVTVERACELMVEMHRRIVDILETAWQYSKA